jgi:hypothetical protein
MTGSLDMVLAPFDGALSDTRRLRLPRALLFAAAAVLSLMMCWRRWTKWCARRAASCRR